jgi:segregation and condensation protein B
MARYHSKDYAFELRAVGGGYQFYSKTEFAPFVRSLLVIRENKKLSRAALETLSIVAYRQPITKAEIEYIRGVNCDYAMQKLLEKQLVEPAGRADLPGKPLLYRTTHFFFEYFGINSIEDLPKLKEFKTDEENLPAAS